MKVPFVRLGCGQEADALNFPDSHTIQQVKTYFNAGGAFRNVIGYGTGGPFVLGGAIGELRGGVGDFFTGGIVEYNADAEAVAARVFSGEVDFRDAVPDGQGDAGCVAGVGGGGFDLHDAVEAQFFQMEVGASALFHDFVYTLDALKMGGTVTFPAFGNVIPCGADPGKGKFTGGKDREGEQGDEERQSIDFHGCVLREGYG